MKINYDKIADAAYLTIKKGKIAKTFPVNDFINIDVDKNGKTLGIELLNASSKQSLNLKKNTKNGIPVEVISRTPVLA